MACANMGSDDLPHVQEIVRCPADLGPKKVQRDTKKVFPKQMHKRPKMISKRWFDVVLGLLTPLSDWMK